MVRSIKGPAGGDGCEPELPSAVIDYRFALDLQRSPPHGRFPSPFGDQEVILFDQQVVVRPGNVDSARRESFSIRGELAVESLMPAKAPYFLALNAAR